MQNAYVETSQPSRAKILFQVWLDVPHAQSLEALAGHFGWRKSTLLRHLARIPHNVLVSLLEAHRETQLGAAATQPAAPAQPAPTKVTAKPRGVWAEMAEEEARACEAAAPADPHAPTKAKRARRKK